MGEGVGIRVVVECDYGHEHGMLCTDGRLVTPEQHCYCWQEGNMGETACHRCGDDSDGEDGDECAARAAGEGE